MRFFVALAALLLSVGTCVVQIVNVVEAQQRLEQAKQEYREVQDRYLCLKVLVDVPTPSLDMCDVLHP